MIDKAPEAERLAFEAAARSEPYAIYSFYPFGNGELTDPPRLYLDTKTEAAWRIWKAARAQSPVDAAPAAEEWITPLNARKLANLRERGYQPIGAILCNFEGEYALFDSSCRWLSQPQYWSLMHEQDGSLFSTPPASLPQAEASCVKPWQDRMTEHYSSGKIVQFHASDYFMQAEIDDWRAALSKAGQGGDALERERSMASRHAGSAIASD